MLNHVPDADGSDIIYADEGSGPAIIVVHGGLSDESAWAKVAGALTDTFRVIRIRRRLYRMDLPADSATDIEREVDDVLRVAATVDGPILLVGHSTGAVIALETLVSNPSPFIAAALYEPPLILAGPLGGPDALPRARAAMAAGHPGKAVSIFLRKVMRAPVWQPLIMQAVARLDTTVRNFVPRQLDDAEAIDRLGNRLDAYVGIPVPVLLITGSRSPGHLRERSARLADRLAGRAIVTVLARQGHLAHTAAPRELARRVADFYQTLLVR